jgi:cytidylate kinase
MAVITISRQFGAGGRTLGERLADRLSYTLVDEQIIEQVAQEANVSQDWVKNVEKEAGGALLRYLSGFKPLRQSYIYKAIVNRHGYIDGHRYVQLLDQIISSIADEGNAVIIGRGGQYILSGRQDCLHLLLVAETEDRIAFMQEKYKLDRHHAFQVVTRQDKVRMNLYRYFGKQDYDQPLLYHSVFNMSMLNLDLALEAVTGMIRT